MYVDFAHTPDALKKTLKALRDLYGDNISIVFGCGGDRDFKKRPMMAKIVNSYCKKIYITDDNPRNEKPEKIRREIIKNINKLNRVVSAYEICINEIASKENLIIK